MTVTITIDFLIVPSQHPMDLSLLTLPSNPALIQPCGPLPGSHDHQKPMDPPKPPSKDQGSRPAFSRVAKLEDAALTYRLLFSMLKTLATFTVILAYTKTTWYQTMNHHLCLIRSLHNTVCNSVNSLDINSSTALSAKDGPRAAIMGLDRATCPDQDPHCFRDQTLQISAAV